MCNEEKWEEKQHFSKMSKALILKFRILWTELIKIYRLDKKTKINGVYQAAVNNTVVPANADLTRVRGKDYMKNHICTQVLLKNTHRV